MACRSCVDEGFTKVLLNFRDGQNYEFQGIPGKYLSQVDFIFLNLSKQELLQFAAFQQCATQGKHTNTMFFTHPHFHFCPSPHPTPSPVTNNTLDSIVGIFLSEWSSLLAVL